MNYRQILAGAMLVTSASSCGRAREANYNTITFVQDGVSYPVTKASDVVVLDRKPFSIRFYGKQYDAETEQFHSAQIAVLDNPADTALLKSDLQPVADVPYFEPGSGFATDEAGQYGETYIGNKGHHYLTSEGDSETRTRLISRGGDHLLLEWPVNAFWYQDRAQTPGELSLKELYFVVFIDRDLNNVIDPGERKIIRVQFK